jgi:hypothetical protein
VETVLDTLRSESYYLICQQTKYHFSLVPNLNKLLADRRANIENDRIEKRIQEGIRRVFPSGKGINVVHFPQKSSDLPNRPELTLAVLDPESSSHDETTRQFIETLIREVGSSARTYKSALIFAIADSDAQLREEARKLLAWEDIQQQEIRLDDDQQQELAENLSKAKRDLKESVWRCYKTLALLAPDNKIRFLDLGLITSSSAANMVNLIINRLKAEGEIEEAISPRFLTRNWSPAFKEWSTKNIRDAFFASPQFPRLLNPDAIKIAISRGVQDGAFAYVAKGSNDRYDPFIFKTHFSTTDVEISDDVFVLKAEDAEAYLIYITDPPLLTSISITPQHIQLNPGEKQTFTVEGKDQYDQPFQIDNIQWSATGGTIDPQGVLSAGDEQGNFTVTARVGEVSARTTFTVLSSNIIDQESDTEEDEEIETTTVPTSLSWQGEITPQKWMQFYTKVLSKYASKQEWKLKLEVRFSVEGEVSQQQMNETTMALQELGLDKDVDLNKPTK